MKTLDLLITKFHEFKEKLSSDNDTSDDQIEVVEKALLPRTRLNAAAEAASAHARNPLSPRMIPTSHPASMPSPEEHAARANMYANFTPKPGVKKTVNEAEAPLSLSVAKNGQWSMGKAERCGKCHAAPCECQTSGILVD